MDLEIIKKNDLNYWPSYYYAIIPVAGHPQHWCSIVYGIGYRKILLRKIIPPLHDREKVFENQGQL